MDSLLRIVSLIPYQIFPARLGGEKGIAVFSDYLGRVTKLTAVTTKNNLPSYAKGYQLLNIIGNSKLRYFNLFLYFRLKKILRRKKATHLIIEHPYYGWLAWLLRKNLPIIWVVHSHNIEYMRSKSIGRWWWKALMVYESWVYRNADKVFFISEDDRAHAISHLKVEAGKSLEITYGIEHSHLPGDLPFSRKQIENMYAIRPNEKILLFNGALYHSTNFEALEIILDRINPRLLSQQGFRYKIIICGKGLPERFNELKAYADQNIIYAGFVDDVSVYFKAADVFLNPILSGGGVKTKAIEALAMNCSVVSTELGAMGIERSVCGNKLTVVYEENWDQFAMEVIRSSMTDEEIPSSFFTYYYWGNIIDKAVKAISS